MSNSCYNLGRAGLLRCGKLLFLVLLLASHQPSRPALQIVLQIIAVQGIAGVDLYKFYCLLVAENCPYHLFPAYSKKKMGKVRFQ